MTGGETEEQRSERLRKFVLDFCDGRIFTSVGLKQEDVRTSFMVLAFLEPRQVPTDTAIVWEYIEKAGPRSIDGMPCFFSCHFMNVEDWDRARVGIEAEMERRAAIKV